MCSASTAVECSFPRPDSSGFAVSDVKQLAERTERIRLVYSPQPGAPCLLRQKDSFSRAPTNFAVGPAKLIVYTRRSLVITNFMFGFQRVFHEARRKEGPRPQMMKKRIHPCDMLPSAVRM